MADKTGPPQPGPYPQYANQGYPAAPQGTQYVVQHQPFQAPLVMAPPIEDHMVRAIIATFFCFWPIGMFAIWNSMQTRDALNRGDLTDAQSKSNTTRMLANVAIGVGSGIIITSVIIVIVVYAFIFSY